MMNTYVFLGSALLAIEGSLGTTIDWETEVPALMNEMTKLWKDGDVDKLTRKVFVCDAVRITPASVTTNLTEVPGTYASLYAAGYTELLITNHEIFSSPDNTLAVAWYTHTLVNQQGNHTGTSVYMFVNQWGTIKIKLLMAN